MIKRRWYSVCFDHVHSVFWGMGLVGVGQPAVLSELREVSVTGRHGRRVSKCLRRIMVIGIEAAKGSEMGGSLVQIRCGIHG